MHAPAHTYKYKQVLPLSLSFSFSPYHTHTHTHTHKQNVQRDAREVEAGRSQGALMAILLEQSGLFLELCAQPDGPVSVAAALCLNDMVRVDVCV